MTISCANMPPSFTHGIGISWAIISQRTHCLSIAIHSPAKSHLTSTSISDSTTIGVGLPTNSSKWLKSISKQVPTVWASTHHTPTASPHPVSILTPLHDRTEQKHLHERSEWHDASSCHPTSKMINQLYQKLLSF